VGAAEDVVVACLATRVAPCASISGLEAMACGTGRLMFAGSGLCCFCCGGELQMTFAFGAFKSSNGA
jgi:hypothetical protein